MFGKREVKLYSDVTLPEINVALKALAAELGIELQTFATNEEGALVERIHQAFFDDVSAVMINPGAWRHYSYALRDALGVLKCPIIEVSMSNVHAREDMKGSKGEAARHHSVVAPLAKGYVGGFGLDSYLLGLRAAVDAAQAQRK